MAFATDNDCDMRVEMPNVQKVVSHQHISLSRLQICPFSLWFHLTDGTQEAKKNASGN